MNIKKRNWAFVLYPESAPTDWRNFIQQTGLTCCVSPLHDKDLNPDNTEKKAHYHIILCYSGPTSYNVVKKLTDLLNCPIPQPLEQVRGYYRYLTHKDNPEKAQYDENDILYINGFNIADFVDLTSREINDIKLNIQTIIRENNIYEYSDLMNLLLDSDMRTEWEIASNHTLFFDRYIGSLRNKLSKGIKISNDDNGMLCKGDK